MPESLANLSQGWDAEPLGSSCCMGTRSGEATGAGELRGLGVVTLGGGLLLLPAAQPLVFRQNMAGGCSHPGGLMLLLAPLNHLGPGS